MRVVHESAVFVERVEGDAVSRFEGVGFGLQINGFDAFHFQVPFFIRIDGAVMVGRPRLPFVMVQACACCPAHGSCSGTALVYCGRLVELDCWRLARRWLTSWLGMMRVPLMTGVAWGFRHGRSTC